MIPFSPISIKVYQLTQEKVNVQRNLDTGKVSGRKDLEVGEEGTRFRYLIVPSFIVSVRGAKNDIISNRSMFKPCETISQFFLPVEATYMGFDHNTRFCVASY